VTGYLSLPVSLRRWALGLGVFLDERSMREHAKDKAKSRRAGKDALDLVSKMIAALTEVRDGLARELDDPP
jgi:hypothetical protein